ncbi:hypothetical protein GQ53DRAFT_743331 [Thozetella sp. PMI_491]|nr:hypothetical protein GQ53DRAFT_743331 [Thozetella sp. PMI_491]
MRFSAPPRAQIATLLAFASFRPLVHAAMWTVTKYVEPVPTTETMTYTIGGTTSLDSYTWTRTRTVKPSITPTASPVTTSTTSNAYLDVAYVYVYLPEGAVAESDLAPTAAKTTDSGDTTTVYVEDVYFTAPASCPTAFTYTSQTTLDIPTDVVDMVTPTSTATTTHVYGIYSTTVIAYLSPNAVPIPSATLSYDFAYTHYVAKCTNPATIFSSSGGGGSSSSSSGNDIDVCTWRWGCAPLKTWIIVLATVLPGLFVLGFIESFFWFRALMRGRRALRLGTICWTCISLWAYCIIAVTQARSRDDQVVLEQQWKQMSAGTRVKLWLKWGFRHKYPVDLLGPEPKANGTAHKMVAETAPLPTPTQPENQTPARDLERGEGAPEVKVLH